MTTEIPPEILEQIEAKRAADDQGSNFVKGARFGYELAQDEAIDKTLTEALVASDEEIMISLAGYKKLQAENRELREALTAICSFKPHEDWPTDDDREDMQRIAINALEANKPSEG